MAIYLIDECDQCGKSVPVHPANHHIGAAYRCPECKAKEPQAGAQKEQRAGFAVGDQYTVKASEPQCAEAAGDNPHYKPEQETGGDCHCQMYPILGYELPHETQSGYNRLASATGLIMQLPQDHDGRNTWLMNYAEAKDREIQTLIRLTPHRYASVKHATEQRDNGTTPQPYRQDMERYIEEQVNAGYPRYYPVHSSNLKRSSLVVEFDAARNWAGDQ